MILTLGRRWDDDTKMDLRELRWGGIDWRHTAEGRGGTGGGLL
jgi:hypothetical protein